MEDRARATLLLVEDDFLIALRCTATLENFGYRVLAAHSGEKAVELGLDAGVDLILMDIDLGKGLSGPEAAALILLERKVPIVFLTSHAEREMVERVRGITRYGYVIKNSGDFVLQSSIEMAFELFEARRELVDRDEKYRLLADNVSDLLWIMDPLTGAWIYVSPSVERLRGYSVAEVMGQSLAEVLTPESFARANENLAQSIARNSGLVDPEESSSIELEHTRKDGSTVWAEVVTRFAKGDRGEPILIGVTRDISERRRVEMALAESQALQAAIADSTQDLIWSVDPGSFGLLTFNKAMLDHFGSTRSLHLVPGMAIEEIFPAGPFVGLWRSFYARALREGAFTTEYLTFSRDKTLLLSFSVLRRDGVVFGISVFGKDITQARQAEEQRERSGEQHRAILMSAMDGYCLLDAGGRIKEANQAYCAMTGYSEAELLGLRINDLDAVESQEATMERIAGIQALGGARFETRHRRRDGSVFDVEVGVQYRSQGGGYFSVFLRDVTEQKLSLAALIAGEDRLHRIISNSSDLICEIDAEGRYTFASERYERVLGYKPEELLGRLASDLVHPEDLLAAGEKYEELKGREGESVDVWRFRDRAGNYRSFECRGSVDKAADGTARTIVVSHDITERKRAEEALQASEVRFRALSELMSDFACSFHLSADGSERLEWIFGSAEELCGFSDGELEAMGGLFGLMHPEDRPGSEEKRHALLVSGTPYAHEFRIIGKGGGVRWLRALATMARRDGRGAEYYIAGRDITERRRDQERIESLLAEKTLILNEVHHRIKNNFNTVHSLLRLQAGLSSNAETAAALEDAGSRVRSMTMLYSDIYESSSDGALSMPAYLPALVREIVANFPAKARVRTEVRCDEFTLEARKLQPLGIIVNELLTNSMKSAFREGSEGLIAVSASLRGPRVLVEVADDGCGIPESVDFSHSSGFGLMLVGSLARQLDGTVRIERVAGTRIVLDFPR